jgi:serine phosphatase RsbU (regulator of sigma subunit)
MIKFRLIYIFVILLITFQQKVLAVEIVDSLIENFPKDASDSVKADFYIKAGTSSKGNTPKIAYELALKALKLSEKSNLLTIYIDAQNLIGSIKNDLGEFNYALESHVKALEKAEIIKDNFRLSASLTYIGNVYLSQNLPSQAINYFEQSLHVAENSDTKNQILSNLYKLGVIYESLDSLQMAYKYYKRSLLVEEETKNKEGIFYSLIGIGSISVKKQNYYQAFIIYNRALKIAQELNVLAYVSLCYSKLGDLLREQKEYVKARNYYLQALSIADSLEFNKDRRDCYKNLAVTNENLQFYNDAYYYLGRFIQINDTLFNQETNEHNLQMQIRFDLRTKEKEIELLKQKDQQGKITRNFLIAGFILITILAFLLFYLNRVKQHHNKLLKEQNSEIEQQKEEISTNLEQLAIINNQMSAKNQQITDSIIYASTIQETILPHANVFKNYFKDSFVFFRPRDIVSGDFYWINYRKGKVYIALADCTGHGVAGAFMSMIGYTLLNGIIEEIPDPSPASILEKLNDKILASLHQRDAHHDDGMDIAICAYDIKNQSIAYAGANQNIAVIQDELITIYQGDIFSIGGTFGRKTNYSFTNHYININPSSTVYLYSDGYQDQFGEVANQKFMSTQFISMLQNICKYSLSDQLEIMSKTFKEWQGSQKQTDDVLVIGLRF